MISYLSGATTTMPAPLTMNALTDTDLYRRGIQTLLASWEEYATAPATPSQSSLLTSSDGAGRCQPVDSCCGT